MATVVIRGNAPTYAPLELYAHDKNSVPLTILNADGTAYSFTGFTAIAEVRKRPGAPLITTLTVALASGLMTISRTTAQMAAIVGQSGWWDCHLVDAGSERYRFLSGPVLVLGSVTA